MSGCSAAMCRWQRIMASFVTVALAPLDHEVLGLAPGRVDLADEGALLLAHVLATPCARRLAPGDGEVAAAAEEVVDVAVAEEPLVDAVDESLDGGELLRSSPR